MYHGFCNRGGCHVSAKNSTAVTTIPKAQATGRLEVVTEATVTSINVDANGRVTGVTYLKDGREVIQPAAAVLSRAATCTRTCACCCCRNRARTRTASRTITARWAGTTSATTKARAFSALFPHNLNNWYGLPAQGTGIDNWADDNFDHSGLDFIGGGNLFVYSDRRPIAAANMNTFGRAPQWGSAWKAFIKENAIAGTMRFSRRPRFRMKTTSWIWIPW